MGSPTPQWMQRAQARLRRWRANRRARHELWRCAMLDARFLKDIGLTEADLLRRQLVPFEVPGRIPTGRSAATTLLRRIESCSM